MVVQGYSITKKPITTRKLQANSKVEWAHQIIHNIICNINMDNVDDQDPWSGILAATMFAIRATFYTTLQASPT